MATGRLRMAKIRIEMKTDSHWNALKVGKTESFVCFEPRTKCLKKNTNIRFPRKMDKMRGWRESALANPRVPIEGVRFINISRFLRKIIYMLVSILCLHVSLHFLVKYKLNNFISNYCDRMLILLARVCCFHHVLELREHFHKIVNVIWLNRQCLILFHFSSELQLEVVFSRIIQKKCSLSGQTATYAHCHHI